MTKTEITSTIKTADSALTAKGIANYAGIDADSRDLQAIESECWEMVESGELMAIDRREDAGLLAFRIA